jgi:hypothetical protein
MKTKNAPRTAISVKTTAFVTSFSLPLARTGGRGASLPSKSTARRPTPGSLEAALSPRAAAERRGDLTRARGSRTPELIATGGSEGGGDAIWLLLGAELVRSPGRKPVRAAGAGRSMR